MGTQPLRSKSTLLPFAPGRLAEPDQIQACGLCWTHAGPLAAGSEPLVALELGGGGWAGNLLLEIGRCPLNATSDLGHFTLKGRIQTGEMLMTQVVRDEPFAERAKKSQRSGPGDGAEGASVVAALPKASPDDADRTPPCRSSEGRARN